MIRCARLRLCVVPAVIALIAGCGQSPAPTVVGPAVVEASEPAIIPAEAKENATTVADGGSFPFPDDAGGKALAKTLAPATPAPMPREVATVRRERKSPVSVENPSPPSGDAIAVPARLPIPAGKELRPVALPDRVPSDLGGALPDLPPRAELPTGSLIRHDSRDVSNPVELPFLSARPVADRAPLTDPTREFTAQSVISANLPLRTAPAPFLRITVPDPFEHVDAAKPRTPVVEDPNRALGSPPPPR